METTVAEPRVAPRTLKLSLIPADKVLLLPRDIGLAVWECLERACSFSGGRYDVPTTLQACAGQIPHWPAQLWTTGYSGGGEPPTVEAAAVSQLTTWPTGLVTVELILLGGRGAREWMQFAPHLKRWAAFQGAQYVQLIGRRGWTRKLPDEWKPIAYVFECPLGAEDHGGR